MTQLWNWVQFDNARLDEQIDKYTGEQVNELEHRYVSYQCIYFLNCIFKISAISLTWSYADVLHAKLERDNAQARLQARHR